MKSPYSRSKRMRRLVIVGFMAAGLAVSGCSSSSDSGDAASSPSTTRAKDETWAGTISALTYNVAGLPEALSGSDPARNTAVIGPKLNAFDLVLMQETWQTPNPNPVAPTRVYFEILKEHSTHKYSAPMPTQPLGSNPKRPSALLADGLGIFSNFPLGEVTRTGWTSCFGGADTSDHGAADCLAMKGFALTTITLTKGVTVDVYNLHGEAGSSPSDQKLQAADYKQLATYINEHSKGHAVILGGDTNLHIEKSPKKPQDVADATIWSTFLKSTGLTDSCDPKSCNDMARIDKFAYRSDGGVDLGVAKRKVEIKRFTDDQGKQLSDHEAVSVTFGWRQAD